MTGGARCTLHPPAFSYKASLQGPVWICFFWTMSAVSLPDPISLFVCLIASCPVIFFSFSQCTFLPSILICCVYVCMNSFCPKTGFAHISSAKSSHPSGTNCSSELCQPSPIHFMNHFLSTFLKHTCAVSAGSLCYQCSNIPSWPLETAGIFCMILLPAAMISYMHSLF